MVAAAAADLGELEVFARPRVAILGAGDELAAPGCARRRAGAIPESVSFGVAGLVRAWGGAVVARRRIADRLDELAAAAARAVEAAEIVVVTGGASVGERDFAKAMFEPLGLEILFAKVAMKPGKPVWLGRVGETLVVGLPGNPSAALVTARLFLAPLVAALAGRRASDAWAWRTAALAAPLAACADRECFHKGRAGADGAIAFANQDSSGQKELAAADLLIRRRPGARALCAGELVETLAF
jgi:molybdopterin molybdotransferase